MPEAPSKKRWDKENTVIISLKLNRRTDADILSRIDEAKPSATQIKALVRKGIAAEQQEE